ncbi:hypothetical protein AAC387_Pa06g0141 [Persea americana]
MALFSPHLVVPSKSKTKTPGLPFFPWKEAPFQSLSFKLSPSKAAIKSSTMAILSESDKPLEECDGVVGVYGDREASRLCCLALQALQYRGQEGVGITVRNNDGSFHSIHGFGLVSDVFNHHQQPPDLPGTCAIGYVRDYSSAIKVPQGQGQGQEPFNVSSFISRIDGESKMLHGANSTLFLSKYKLIAVCDSSGSRPLVMGRRRRNGAVVFASERCALDLIEADFDRHLHPGEALVVEFQYGEKEITSLCLSPNPNPTQRNEAFFFNLEQRSALGEILATEAPVECDVVVPVPDSGYFAAQGYAAKAGVRWELGLSSSFHMGQTFMEPPRNATDYKFGLKIRIFPSRHVLEGKRVVVADDSVETGTTCSKISRWLKIVKMVKEAGAKEVHMRIASLPVTGSSSTFGIEEIRKFIGSDSLAFVPLKSMRELLGDEAANLL